MIVSDRNIYCLSFNTLYIYTKRKFRPVINLQKLFNKNKFKFPRNSSYVIHNSELFIIGGVVGEETQNTVYKINLQSRKVTQLPSLNDDIYGSTSIIVDDMIYTIGGNECIDYFDPLNIINRYNIKDTLSGWIRQEDMPEGTFKPVLLYHENNIYICSTDWYEVCITRYNPQENKSYLCKSKKCRTNHLSAFIEGDRICIITTDKTFYYSNDLWEERENFPFLSANDCVSF